MLGAHTAPPAPASVPVCSTGVPDSSASVHDSTHDRVGARGYPIKSGKQSSQPTCANHPIKRAAAALFPKRSLRSLTDEEFWDCVRVARAWLRRSGQWARTMCRKGHELAGEKCCRVCEAERESRYRAELRERNARRPPKKEREARQRQRRARAA